MILLLVDNCPSNIKLNYLHCIKLVFLPLNCTLILQPMNQWMSQTKFKKLLVLKMIDNIEHKNETKLNVLDAILLLT